jgi:hypothetical protein
MSRIKGSLVEILLLPLFFISCVYSLAQESSKEFTFYKIVEDKKLYDKDPGNYNKEGTGKYEVYIERKPSLTLRSDEIDSIVIDRHRIPVDTKDAIEVLEEEAGRKPKKKDSPLGFEYSVSLIMIESGAKRFRDFANAHLNEYVEWRFSNKKLGESRMVGPFTSKGFTMGITERNKEKIAELFEPIREKVTWRE